MYNIFPYFSYALLFGPDWNTLGKHQEYSETEQNAKCNNTVVSIQSVNIFLWLL